MDIRNMETVKTEKEMKGMLLTGHRKKVSVMRATQERTGILYTEQRILDRPEAVVQAFGGLFEHAGVEYVMAVALTGKLEPVALQIMGIGGITSAYISIPDIIRFVLLSNCNHLLLIHNHPSGNPEASREDVALTKRVKEACQLLQMELVDHVIIGENGTGYSIREERMTTAEKLAKGA